jgi:uncharacterized membrane protein YphA (DoxX/SURF4 family)
VGASLAVQGIACFSPGGVRIWTWTLGILAIAIGASLLVGFLTPVLGGAAALIGVGIAGGTPASIFVALVAVAVVLLGPGAFSLDARLFGRREIVIAQFSSRPPDEDA